MPKDFLVHNKSTIDSSLMNIMSSKWYDIENLSSFYLFHPNIGNPNNSSLLSYDGKNILGASVHNFYNQLFDRQKQNEHYIQATSLAEFLEDSCFDIIEDNKKQFQNVQLGNSSMIFIPFEKLYMFQSAVPKTQNILSKGLDEKTVRMITSDWNYVYDDLISLANKTEKGFSELEPYLRRKNFGSTLHWLRSSKNNSSETLAKKINCSFDEYRLMEDNRLSPTISQKKQLRESLYAKNTPFDIYFIPIEASQSHMQQMGTPQDAVMYLMNLHGQNVDIVSKRLNLDKKVFEKMLKSEKTDSELLKRLSDYFNVDLTAINFSHAKKEVSILSGIDSKRLESLIFRQIKKESDIEKNRPKEKPSKNPVEDRALKLIDEKNRYKRQFGVFKDGAFLEQNGFDNPDMIDISGIENSADEKGNEDAYTRYLKNVSEIPTRYYYFPNLCKKSKERNLILNRILDLPDNLALTEEIIMKKGLEKIKELSLNPKYNMEKSYKNFINFIKDNYQLYYEIASKINFRIALEKAGISLKKDEYYKNSNDLQDEKESEIEKKEFVDKFSHDKSLDQVIMNNCSKKKPLSIEEEAVLAKKIRDTGDNTAINTLVEHNLRFLVTVARNYQNQGVILSDLINEGAMGLIRAAKRFDERKNFKFISYAVWWIRQAILQALAEQSRTCKIPLNRAGTIYKINRTTSKLEQKYQRRPTDIEIQYELEISKEEYDATLISDSYTKSLDASISEDGATLHDLIGTDCQTDKKTDAFLLSELVDDELEGRLTDREKEVVKLYFGIGQERPNTLEEIGQRFNLTRERARQIKVKGIKRLERSKNLKQIYSNSQPVNVETDLKDN